MLNEWGAAKEREATLRAQQKMRDDVDQNDGTIDYTAQLTVLNDSMNATMKQEAQEREARLKYIHDKRTEYLTEAHQNPQMLPVINQYLRHKKINNQLNNDSFNTLYTREQINAWPILKDGIAKYHEEDTGQYDFGAIDADQDVQLAIQTLFPSQSTQDDDNADN